MHAFAHNYKAVYVALRFDLCIWLFGVADILKIIIYSLKSDFAFAILSFFDDINHQRATQITLHE